MRGEVPRPTSGGLGAVFEGEQAARRRVLYVWSSRDKNIRASHFPGALGDVLQAKRKGKVSRGGGFISIIYAEASAALAARKEE